ncbi:MAG: hypothetical protein GPW18_02115 [Euryarchaeota archaeon]|nr:hypothetical protein [Euryarchaeota archaeon]
MTEIENMSICEILNYLLKHSNWELYNRISPIYNDMCRRGVQKQVEVLKLPEPQNLNIIDDSELFH